MEALSEVSYSWFLGGFVALLGLLALLSWLSRMWSWQSVLWSEWHTLDDEWLSSYLHRCLRGRPVGWGVTFYLVLFGGLNAGVIGLLVYGFVIGGGLGLEPSLTVFAGSIFVGAVLILFIRVVTWKLLTWDRWTGWLMAAKPEGEYLDSEYLESGAIFTVVQALAYTPAPILFYLLVEHILQLQLGGPQVIATRVALVCLSGAFALMLTCAFGRIAILWQFYIFLYLFIVAGSASILAHYQVNLFGDNKSLGLFVPAMAALMGTIYSVIPGEMIPLNDYHRKLRDHRLLLRISPHRPRPSRVIRSVRRCPGRDAARLHGRIEDNLHTPRQLIGKVDAVDPLTALGARYALESLGGEAVDAIVSCAEQCDRSTISWLLKGIQLETSQLKSEVRRLRCPEHLCAVGPHVIRVHRKTYTIYGCRKCKRSRELLRAKSVAVVLCHDMTPLQTLYCQVLRVNWFRRPEPIDFTHLEIGRATDFEFERFMLAVDANDFVQRHLESIICVIDRASEISQANVNLMRSVFAKVQIK